MKKESAMAERLFKAFYFMRLRSMRFKCRKEIAQLSRFKNIHKGERCFIIGNGPSLKMSDLDMIKNEYSFSSNKIYLAFPNTSWRPCYYCVSDNKVLIRTIDEVNKLNAKEKFLSINSLAWHKKQKSFYKNANYYEQLLPSSHDNMKPDFSDDIVKGISDGNTVSYIMIQLACYMGFDEIYLIGMDHNYQKDNAYFVSNYKKGEFVSIDMAYATVAFEKARDYADKNNIKIYNATHGGKLEVFERVDFDSLFDMK